MCTIESIPTLRWRRPLAQQSASIIGLITKPGEPRAAVLAAKIAEWAVDRGITLLVDEQVVNTPPGAHRSSNDELVERSQIIAVLGGDGTMIAAARLVGGRGTPVIGINLGSLGYLTDFSVDDTVNVLDCVARGDFEVDQRTMLDWRATRDGEVTARGTVLNDVVINKSTVARIIEIECRVNDALLTTYRSDGLIVATPTGSTAYNLSAGGPIIHPDTKAICISPICPHTLTNRPIVLPDDVEIKLKLITREEEVMITSDGQVGYPLTTGEEIRIRKCTRPFNMIQPRGRDYFQILRDKLRWGGH